MTVAAPPRPPETDIRPRLAPRRRRHPVLAVAAFVVAFSVLVTATVFAFVAASGRDGAGDPESAVRDLLDAVSHRDVIGVLEALPPAEREAVRDELPGIADELTRLGLLSPLSLSSVPGVDIELRDIRYHVTKVFGEVGRVQLTSGEIVVTTRPDAFPLPERTRRLLEDDLRATIEPNGTHTIDLAASQPNLVAIKDAGGWHVSLFYTLAEAIRGADTGPMPRYNEGLQPVGSETPAAAVRELFDAAVSLDATRAVTLAYPPEARALYDYATLFLPEARRRAQGIAADEPFSMSIKQLDLDATTEGTTRQVRVVGFDGRITDGNDRRHFVYADGCLTDERRRGSSTDIEQSFHTCDGTLGPAPSVTDSGDGSRIDEVTAWQGLGRAFPTFVVQERAGRWYVSPTRTVLTTIHELLRHLQPSDVDAFTDRLGLLQRLYGLPPR